MNLHNISNFNNYHLLALHDVCSLQIRCQQREILSRFNKIMYDGKLQYQ